MAPIKIVLTPDDVKVQNLFEETVVGKKIYDVEYPFKPFDPNWWLPHYFVLLAIVVLLIVLTFVLSTGWFKAFLFRLTGAEFTLHNAARKLSEDRPTGDYDYKTKLNDYYHWEKLMDSYVELKKLGQWFVTDVA
uniref:ResB-like domain-containing protein n=1 Tax=Trichuris muris TaxID=70415 RepID=A0A5S6QSP2_TRIMR